MTATVVPPARTAAACAAPSMPTASPDTTLAPTATRSAAIRAAMRRPASVARRVPTIGDRRRWRRGRPGRRARTGRAAASRSRPAGAGRRRPRPSRPAGRAPRSGRSVAPACSPASAIAVASVDRQATGVGAPPRSGPRRGSSRPVVDPARRRGLQEDRPTAPVPPEQRREPDRPEAVHRGQDGPGVAFSAAGIAASRMTGARSRPPVDSGPATPTPSTQLTSAAARRRSAGAVPGGLVEVRLAHDVVAASRRSSARPGAAAPSRVRSPARARPGATTCRSAARVRRHAARSGRPVSRPLSTPDRLSVATARAVAIRAATAAEPSGSSARTMASGATRGIAIHRSIRSRSGPDTRRW